MNSLNNWINKKYNNDDEIQKISKNFNTQKPFKYIRLTDFFENNKYETMLEKAKTMPLQNNVNYGVTKRAEVKWGPWNYPEMIRFMLGSEFRNFLGQITQKKILPKPGFIPQLNVFNEGSAGYQIHNDMGEGKHFVTLFQMSEGYKSGLGGELGIFERDENGVFHTTDMIEPIGNSFVLFEVHKDSFHNVQDLLPGYKRRVLCWDWISI